MTSVSVTAGDGTVQRQRCQGTAGLQDDVLLSLMDIAHHDIAAPCRYRDTGQLTAGGLVDGKQIWGSVTDITGIDQHGGGYQHRSLRAGAAIAAVEAAPRRGGPDAGLRFADRGSPH